jgi:ubiquitination network signaling protein AcrB
MPNPIPPQTLRPSSPASPVATLKTSIAAFESRNNDITTKQRKIRKEHKVNSAKLKQEIENLAEKLSRHASTAKGLTSRQMQYTQTIRQNEEAISNLIEEIDAFAEVPEEALKEWQEHKSSWEKVRNELSRVQEDIQRAKEDNRATLISVQGEELTATQKRDRLQARVKKLSEQHKRLTSSTAAPENRRTNSDLAIRANERQALESYHEDQLEALRRTYQEMTERIIAIQQQVSAMEYTYRENKLLAETMNHSHLQYDSRPITPEGDLPGTNPNPPGSTQSTGYGRLTIFSTPESQHALPAVNYANGHSLDRSNRARSQSALSGNSVYFGVEDFDDDDPIPMVYKRKTGMESVLEGSDSRSSSSSSPHFGQVPPIGYRHRNSPGAA